MKKTIPTIALLLAGTLASPAIAQTVTPDTTTTPGTMSSPTTTTTTTTTTPDTTTTTTTPATTTTPSTTTPVMPNGTTDATGLPGGLQGNHNGDNWLDKFNRHVDESTGGALNTRSTMRVNTTRMHTRTKTGTKPPR